MSDGKIHIRTTKLELIAEIFEIYIRRNPIRKDEWYGETFDSLYDKSLLDLTVLKDVLVKSKPYGPSSNRGYTAVV